MYPIFSSLKRSFVQHLTFRRLTIALFVFSIPMAGFLSIADEVHEREPIYGDVAILQWLNSISSPALDNLMVAITTLGDAESIVLITLVITGFLYYRKRRRQAALVFFGVAGAAFVNYTLKLFFQRDRPALWEQIITETSFSFPSGHAMASSALVFALIVVFWQTKYRLIVIFSALVFMVLVGVSRLYLGVHYPSDVLGGWCVSLLWVAIVRYIIYRHDSKTTARN